MEMASTSVNSSRSKVPSNLQFKQDNRPAIEEVRSTVLPGLLWLLSLGGGWGLLNKISYGRLRPFNSVYHFWWKRYPFLAPFIHKWYPFHLPSLEQCIRFNCSVNHSPRTVFLILKIRLNHSSRKFSFLCLSQSAIMLLLALLGPLTDRSVRFSNPLIYFN